MVESEQYCKDHKCTKCDKELEPKGGKILAIIAYLFVIGIMFLVVLLSDNAQDAYMLEPLCKYETVEGIHSERLVVATRHTYFDCKYFNINPK